MKKRKKFRYLDVITYWDNVPSGYIDMDGNKCSVLECLYVSPYHPQCFACEFSRLGEYTSPNLEQNWSKKKSGLEKHHFHPLSLGGKDEISNIFILCTECHNEVPTVPMDLEQIIRWCRNRETYFDRVERMLRKSFLDMVETECDTEEDIANFLYWFMRQDYSNTKKVIRDSIVEKKATTHFNRIPINTYAYMFFNDYKKQTSGT